MHTERRTNGGGGGGGGVRVKQHWGGRRVCVFVVFGLCVCVGLYQQQEQQKLQRLREEETRLEK